MEQKYEWKGVQREGKKQYICCFCGSAVASEFRFARYSTFGSSSHIDAEVYICPFCENATYFPNEYETGVAQIPGPKPCGVVFDLPENVSSIYEEARSCFSVNAFVGSALCSRKLLMNIAADKGAKAGESFTYYVDYLANKGFVPSDCQENLDHVRKKGNEATHELPAIEAEDAFELLVFLEIVLKMIYEFPAALKQSRKKMELKKGSALSPIEQVNSLINNPDTESR